MGRYYEVIDLLKSMISYPSFSRDETAVTDFLQAGWQKTGQKVFREGNDLWIIAPNFDSGRPTPLLNSHIDTVRPASGWTKDPFTPEETEGGQLHGLGSNDTGVSVASLYEVFCILSEKKQPYSLILLASRGEEVSGKSGIEGTLAELLPISFTVVGKPTSMQLAVAEREPVVLDRTVIGKARHAVRNKGINVITLTMKNIKWFSTYQFPEESGFLGPVRMTVTIIHAGTQHNVAPDECEFTVDIRTNGFYTNEQLLELIKERAHCEIKTRNFRLSSTHTDLDHLSVRRVILVGRESFGSPMLSNQALMCFPSVEIGPGNSAHSHSADEYIKGPEVRGAIDAYVKLLNGL